MTGIEIVQEIVSILTAGIAGLAQGIGSGVNTFATALAFTGTGQDQALSIFMILVVVFAGLALAVGLTRLIFNWLQNLGGH